MAGFFSLGGGGGIGGGGGRGRGEEETNDDNNNNQRNEIPTEGWFWYNRNNEDYNNVQQQQELFHQRILHYQQQQHQDLFSTAALLGMGPSNTNIATRSLINVVDGSTASRSPFMMMRTAQGGSGSSSGGGGGGISCQDCGNQAKKDCSHMRCRTCCKSRGFDCPTHVKSTWVPASKRRERQQQLASLHLTSSTTTTKRLRETTAPSSSAPAAQGGVVITTPHVSTLVGTTGLEGGRYPPEVSSQAVFRCVRVSGVEEEEEQYAYQTAVSIGGHVFKGILYDQGPENTYISGGESSSSIQHQHQHQQQQLNLITSGAGAGVGTAAGDGGGGSGVGSGAFMDPNCLYPAPLNTYFAGTQFFPSPRS